MIKIAWEGFCLWQLLRIGYKDATSGKIKNKDLALLFLGCAGISFCAGDFLVFVVRSAGILGLLLLFSEKLPYDKIGGGDIKMIGVLGAFFGTKIFYLLLIGLTVAVLFGLIMGKKRIRLGPYLALSAITVYFLPSIYRGW